jgi:hypothetical protein
VRGLSPQFGDQRFENAVDVLDNVIVPDADDAVAERVQIGITLSICSAFGVLTAVDLDDDVPITASEVDVIATQ